MNTVQFYKSLTYAHNVQSRVGTYLVSKSRARNSNYELQLEGNNRDTNYNSSVNYRNKIPKNPYTTRNTITSKHIRLRHKGSPKRRIYPTHGPHPPGELNPLRRAHVYPFAS